MEVPLLSEEVSFKRSKTNPYPMRSSLGRKTRPSWTLTSSSSAREQAMLIKAQSYIVQLESELSSLRKEVAAERIKRGPSSSGCTESVLEPEGHHTERLHKLEQERCELVEEVGVVKKKLYSTEQELLDLQRKHQELKDSRDEEQLAHGHQVEGMLQQMTALDALTDEMNMELTESRLSFFEEHLDDLEDVKEEYRKSIVGMRGRLKELESVESELLKSQAMTKHLERQLRTYRQDALMVDSVKDTVRCETLEFQIQRLREENASLHEDRTNTDLLRYQVQTLKERCEKFDELEEEVTHLRIENTKLSSVEGSAGNMSAPSLQVQLAELQQREVVATRRIGELTTQLRIVQQDLSKCKEDLKESERLLKREKKATSSWEEKAQRLDRRLIFVTKERDGCVNVLNSYRSDSSVDVMMSKFMIEMEHQLENSKNRITELEKELATATQ